MNVMEKYIRILYVVSSFCPDSWCVAYSTVAVVQSGIGFLFPIQWGAPGPRPAEDKRKLRT